MKSHGLVMLSGGGSISASQYVYSRAPIFVYLVFIAYAGFEPVLTV